MCFVSYLFGRRLASTGPILVFGDNVMGQGPHATWVHSPFSDQNSATVNPIIMKIAPTTDSYVVRLHFKCQGDPAYEGDIMGWNVHVLRKFYKYRRGRWWVIVRFVAIARPSLNRFSRKSPQRRTSVLYACKSNFKLIRHTMAKIWAETQSIKKYKKIWILIKNDELLIIWNASRICVSSLRRGHANLLCIVPILVYVPPKRVH